MSRSGQTSKARAICVILLILVSTATMIGLLSRFGLIQEPSNNDGGPYFSDCPFEVTTVSTAEGTWVSFDPNDDPGTPAEAHVIVSDTMGLTVVADISGYWKDNKTQIIDATSYSLDTIHVPGMHPIRTSGTPDLPHLIAYVEIPKDIDIAVEEVRGSHHILEGYSVGPNPSLPASTWPRDAQSVPRIEFGDIYDSNAFYPSEKVSITGGDSAASIIMRGRRLLEIRFHPIQYNASSNDLRVHARLMARLNYSRPAQIEPARPGLQCKQFENVFDGFLLNYKLWNASTIAPTEPDTFPDSNQFTIASFPSERLAAEYLIIVHDDFVDEAERLARWKNRTGLLTRFYTTSQVVEFAEGSGDVTPQQIKSFIQYTYSSWNPGPMFVLLFGDSEYIPTNYEMVHKDFTVYHQEQGFIGEDLEYFTVDGTDYIPDLFYGRISVDSVDEARTAVNKILAYEKNPPDKASFYKNILAASYFDDIQIDNWDPGVPPTFYPDGDGVEDEGYPYIEGSEAVKDYLERLEGFDYEVHVNYSANTTVPHVTPYKFYDWWIDFPEYLETYPWMSIEDVDLDASTQAILSNFNEGRFLVYHIDHGGSKNSHFLTHEIGTWQEIEGWANPRFETTDLVGLANGNNLSLVINIDCSTGWFDGETDQEAMGDNFAQAFDNIESLAEMLLRKEGGGAIAVIAASRVIYNWPGVDLLEGIINAFWPGYFEEDFHPVYEVGAALHYGKMNLLSVYGYDGVIDIEGIPQHETEATFRMYHVFGDPTTPLWTREPSDLVVEYPSKIGTQRNQRFAVKVTNSSGFPVARAQVCIQMENEEYQVSRTNFLGYVEFSVGDLPSGEMNVTVTMQNSTHHFIPHTGTIEVIDSSATVGGYPGRGEKDIQVAFTVDGFTLNQQVTVFFDTQESTFTYTEASRSASFIVLDGIVGPINVVANQTNGNTAVTVFYRLPDIYVDPYLERGEQYFNPSIIVKKLESDGTWTLLYEEGMQSIEEGETYGVWVGVQNQGEHEAEQVAVDLYYHAYGAGLSLRKLNTETKRLDVDVGDFLQQFFYWYPTDTGATCLIAEINHPYDINIRNNVARVNAYVLGVTSPGNVSFYIGNPTGKEAFPYIELRQEGTHSDYWNATVRTYSSCPLASGENVTVDFVISVNDSVDPGMSRIFIIDLYIDGQLWEGIRINVTKMETETQSMLDIIWGIITNPFFWTGVVIVIVIVGVCCLKQKQS